MMSYKRDYLSYSALKQFEKSPNHYIQYVTKERDDSSKSMNLGSATHAFILEPDKFAERYFVAPKIDKRTADGKRLAKEIEETGKIHVSTEDFEMIDRMAKNIERSQWGKKLVSDLAVSYEQEFLADINGYPFKGFIDIVGESYVADLKTDRDASPAAFMKSADNLGYHIQAAIYSTITGKEFYWVVVENAAPHNCSVFVQSEEDYEKSRAYLFDLIDRFKAWDGEYDGYTAEIVTLSLPPWSKISKFGSEG